MSTKPTPKALAGAWLLCTLALTAFVLLARLAMTGGDDADPARQRPGIIDLGELPIAAPTIFGARNGEPTTVFFAGRSSGPRLCEAIADEPDLLGNAQAVVISDTPITCSRRVVVVVTPVQAAADAYGLPMTRDGGEAVGYALVDSTGQIRYRTLDPEIDRQLGEVRTMLRAVT